MAGPARNERHLRGVEPNPLKASGRTNLGTASMRRPGASLIVSIAALVVAVSGVTYASIPDGTEGVIYGCYKSSAKGLGAMRAIDEQLGRACGAKETRSTGSLRFRCPIETGTDSARSRVSMRTRLRVIPDAARLAHAR